jgi:hypothetical protein
MRIRWVGYVACTSKKRNAYKILVEKPQGKAQAQMGGHYNDSQSLGGRVWTGFIILSALYWDYQNFTHS